MDKERKRAFRKGKDKSNRAEVRCQHWNSVCVGKLGQARRGTRQGTSVGAIAHSGTVSSKSLVIVEPNKTR